MKKTKITIYAKEIKKDDKTFITYYAKDKNGRYLTVRFTKECYEDDGIPANNFICEIDDLSANISENDGYFILWVKECKVLKVFENVRLEDFFE